MERWKEWLKSFTEDDFRFVEIVAVSRHGSPISKDFE